MAEGAVRLGWLSGRERAFLLAVTLAAVSTTLMLQATRVFVAYLVFTVDQSNRTMLAISAVLVFGLVGAGGFVARALGRPRAVLATGGGLLLSRLVLQFWGHPEARVVLGALGIILWGWLLVTLLSLTREGSAYGLVLGLGLDLAIRIGFRTVDLPWMPGIAAHVVTLLLLGSLGMAAWGVSRASYVATPASAVSLVAIGPGLAVYHLMTGNIGLTRELLDAGFGGATALLALGLLLGVTIAALADTWPRAREQQLGGALGGVLLVALVVAGLWFLWQRPTPTSFGFVAGAAGSAVLLSMAALGGAPGRLLRPGGAAAWLMAGMLLQVALLFAYYTFTGPPLIIVIAWAIFALGALATGRYTGEHAWRPVVSLAPVAVLCAALVLAFGTLLLGADDPQPGPPAPGEITVMSYNIQSGYALDNWWSLERTAQTIEAQNPDVVVLQEVGRGWLVVTPVDQVEWLSRRLGMPYVFGPNSDDGQWGNAILSRAPLSLTDNYQYETTQNLKRGVVSALIETEAGGVWVFGTHLDNPRGGGNVRLRQVNELIEVIGGRTPALLLGDLNADPDSDVLATLDAAGLHDHPAWLGPDATTSQDQRRIDYILASPDLTVTELHIPQVWTSDHLPVVARVVLE
jgi:endonuclease/exonuclease/phosphatase family metal-dependent hydrolase